MADPEIDVVIEDARWEDVDLARLSKTATRATLDHLKLTQTAYELVIMGCDDPRIAELNAEFRDQAKPTNVLSWPAQDLAPLVPGETPSPPRADLFEPFTALGDVAISFDTCTKEAETQSKSLANHSSHLIVHGVLHLLGYDHETDADATLMEQQEVAVLASMGIESPY